MKRNHFVLNQNNQLLIKPQRAKRLLATDGQFHTSKDNNLIYLLNKPAGWRREYGLPEKVRFKGNWRLSPNYDLELHLDKTERQFKGDCLVLHGKILSAGQEGLLFQIKSHDKRGVNRFSLLKLTGTWRADEFNRIIFQVNKKAKPDTLIFKGAWQVDKHQQIIYEYEKIEPKTKRKIKNTLAFVGFWQISSANRLSYILSGTFPGKEVLQKYRKIQDLSYSSLSRFDLRVHLQTPNVYPKKGEVKYRLGIGIRENLQPGCIRIITLYGTWRFSRKLGLYFEIDYGRGRVKRMIFDSELNLSQRDKVVFRLMDKQGKRIGISVIFRRSFLSRRDAEWFLRLKRDFQEKKAEAGVRIAF